MEFNLYESLAMLATNRATRYEPFATLTTKNEPLALLATKD